MSKPIDPNLNDNFDIELDLMGGDEPIKKASDINSESVSIGEIEMQLKEKRFDEHHHHSSGSEHHHHFSGSEHHHHSSGGSHHSHSSSSKGHSSHHSSSKKKKKKKMPIAAKIAIAFLIILLLLPLIGVGTVFFLENRGKSDFINNMTVQQNENYQEIVEYNNHKYKYNEDIVSIAFMGIDKRDLDDNSAIGSAGQADADMVAAIDTNTGKTKIIAIPRDTIVDVDVYSESGIFLHSKEMQLCLSYAYGDGGESSAKNVTKSMSRILYGIPINKYFTLDLNGIAPINDSIGGVTVVSMYDFPDHDIKKGDSVHLTGDLTETYVRRRDMDSVDASLNRTDRQIQYIKAFASQLAPAAINDLGVIRNLYSTASSYSNTDLDISNVTYLATRLLSKGINDFETTSIPGEMKLSDEPDATGRVYAEFYPDEEATLQIVLDTFYTQVD